MFELFKGHRNHFIGIDFGTSSIKVVELSYKDQKASLENYGAVELDFAQSKDQLTMKNISFEQKLKNILASLVQKMDITSGQAYVAIPGFSGLITIIELPDMRDEELSKAIQFEAHKYIPSSLDEIAMSWEVIEKFETPQDMLHGEHVEKKIKVLLVAAPKREIDHYDSLVEGLDLTVNAIELETFSITRALVGDDPGTFFIIDIGSRATNLILVEKGIIRVNRNIDAGGNEITTAIGDSLNISRQRAESFKRGEKDLLNSKESAIIVPVLELIVGESQRILTAYKEKNKELRIDGIILSGGTSKMNGIEEYFSRTLNSKISVGNPWRRIVVDEKVVPFTQELGGSFSVAIGLALRGVEDYKRS